MEEVSDMAALFVTKANPTGAPEVSPVERLLNEFEAHEAKEEKSLGGVSETLPVPKCRIPSRGFSCNSSFRMKKSIVR